MKDWIPFTYILKWNTGMKYYGAKWAKGCHPDDLWTTYFSSSDLVSEYKQIHGDPVVVKITRRFPNDPHAAYIWETKFLERINARNRPDFLNQHNNDGKVYNCWKSNSYRARHSKRLSERNLERWKDPDYRNKQSELKKIWYSKPENLQLRKDLAKSQWADPSFKAMMKRKKWWNNGEISIMTEHRPGETWILGRLPTSEESKAKQSEVRTGVFFWNNGIVTKKHKEWPGEGWTRGRVKKSKTN
jgi:hypothetical protein